MIYELNAISTGKIETLTYGKKQMQSALNKTVFTDTCWLTTTGFCDDEQAYKGHGGPDKAYAYSVNQIIKCGKMISQNYQITRCLEKI